MKKNLLNKFWLRVGIIVAVMTTAFAGTVKAESVTYSLTPNQASTGSTATSYITTTTEFSYNGVSWKMNQWNPSTLQIKTNQSNYNSQFNFRNTSAFPGKITQVVMSFSTLTVTEPAKLLFKGGTSEVTQTGSGTAGVWDATNKTLTWTPASSDEFTYFAFYQNGKAASGNNYLASTNAIVVTYEESGSTLADSDLALTNAPIALNFDLYNNTEPQTINFTTSSTGAVTVSESEYVTTSVNGNTITVTPVKVTPSAQTITVSQAADDTYAEGSATFTVNVTNSTPFVGSIFIFNTDAGLQDLGINKPSSGNGTNLNVNTDYTIDNVTMNVTHGGTATRVWNSNGSTDLRVYKSGGSLTFTVPIGYKINKITFTGSSVNFSNVTNNVWQGTPASSVTLSATNTSNITTITVEYEVSNDPVLSADDINIACNAVEGVITYTLTNPAANGVLTASTTSDWLTIGTVGETISFTCETNTTATVRTANVTITYTYGDSQSVTKEVAVTQEGKKDAGLAYATTSVTKFEGDANFTNELTNPFSLVVTYASSEETVATVDNNGEVTILATGTTTITASYPGDDTYLPGSASYTLVVNEPFVAEDGVFDFVEAGMQGYDYGSGVPIAHSSNGTYIYEDKTWTAGNVTLISSGKYRWWYNGHELRFYNTVGDNEATKESVMTISVPEGKVITGIEVSGGKNWTTDCGTYENGTWTGYSQTVVFTFTGTSSNNVTKVVVTYGDPISVTFNSSGYATFASSSPIDFSGVEADGYTAWAITSANKTTSVINFSKITGAVAAGTGVLLMGEPGETVYPVVTTSGDDISSTNLLVGITEATYVESNLYYGLKGDTFKRVNAGTVPAGRALLPASQVGTDVKAFTFNFEDDATGIKSVNVDLNEGIYNLAGQRLSKMQKGINIVNGKKVLK